MTLDYVKPIVPQSVADLPRFLEEELTRIGLAMSTLELDEAPGYIVRDPDTGEIEGILTSVNGVLTLVGTVVQNGEITGYRPVGVLGSEWRMACTEWTVPGMGLAANSYGYSLQVLNDGETVVAVPMPPPAEELVATGVTDHYMSGQELIWVKLTGESNPAVGTIAVGSAVTYGAFISSRATQRGGQMEFGFGVNGAAPLATGDTISVGVDTEFYRTGVLPLLTLLSPGDTISLWARCTNEGPQSNIWITGSVDDSFVRVTT